MRDAEGLQALWALQQRLEVTLQKRMGHKHSTAQGHAEDQQM